MDSMQHLEACGSNKLNVQRTRLGIQSLTLSDKPQNEVYNTTESVLGKKTHKVAMLAAP